MKGETGEREVESNFVTIITMGKYSAFGYSKYYLHGRMTDEIYVNFQFNISALSNGMSAVIASILSVGLFAGIQVYRQQLASSGPLTIFGGSLSSVLFVLILTVSPLYFVLYP